MKTNFFSSYLQDNKTLAKTLVIKSQVSCNLINTHLKLIHGDQAVDETNPFSWKYNLNLAGEYHPVDTMMTVVSLDTLEPIEFTKANLRIHTATAKAYIYGTRYYFSLLERYPAQEQLILGILYPANIVDVVHKRDGSILSYPSYLVEPQELSLIFDLEQWIYRYLMRWDVKLFSNTDSLYQAVTHAQMYLNLLPKLMTLRLKRCKTNEVHSFHVREYLASHFQLDAYLPYMTAKQKMWLYRNIRYIARHPGSTEQFEILVQKLLTDRRIPLNEYSVRQLTTFDANYKPQIIARRKPINGDFNVPANPQFSFDELLKNEAPTAYGNPAEIKETKDSMEWALKSPLSSVIQTKDLESKMVDYSDSVPEPLVSVLFRLWILVSNKDLYNVNITFRDPKSSIDYNLYSRDALIYYVYLALNAYGIYQGVIPAITNVRQWKIPKATESRLLEVADSKTYPDLKSIAKTLVSRMPEIKDVTSSSAFFELGYSLYEESLYHWYLTSNTQEMYERGYVENMVNRLYVIEDHDMGIGDMSVESWLSQRNLPQYNLTVQEAEQLMMDIFQSSVGWYFDKTKQMKYIQKAMIEVLRKLISYSVQIIYDINDSTVIPINWAAVRPGQIVGASSHETNVNNPIHIIDAKSRGHQFWDAVSKDPIPVSIAKVSAVNTCDVDIPDSSVAQTTTSMMYSIGLAYQLTESNDFSNLDQLSPEELRKLKTLA